MEKNRLICISILILSSQICFSQVKWESRSSIVEYKQFSNGQGVILDKDYNPKIRLPDLKERFTPSDIMILKAEEMLHLEYQKALRKFHRQYIGYINDRNDSILLVQFLRIVSQSKMKEYFPNWKNEYIVGFGRFYEENTNRYIINFNQNRISKF